MTEQLNYFTSFSGDLYENDIIRGCIRPFSRTVGKLKAIHILKTNEGAQRQEDLYMDILLKEPNPYMSGQLLQEKLAIDLELNNNAFAFIVRDANGVPNQIIPLSVATAEAVQSPRGELELRFNLLDGQVLQFSYEDVIHLRQDFSKNGIFGKSNEKSIKELMNIISTSDQGVVHAIKNSASIRWLLKFGQILNPKDIKRHSDEFANQFLNIDNNVSNVAAIDNKADAIPIKPNDYVPNVVQISNTIKRVYSLFGTSEKIIQGTYTEEEWNSYYALKIEPIARQMSEEFTRKLFSRIDRFSGNQIEFESSSSLQYSSVTTKLELSQMVDRGAMTPNEWRLFMNLSPIDGGDETIRRLDTGVVNLKQAKHVDDNKDDNENKDDENES